VDARVSRILANELVGLVDRGFRLFVLVVRVHEVELALARGVREGEARLELLVVERRVAIVAVVERTPGALVECVGIAQLLARLVPASAEGQQQRYRRGQNKGSHAKISANRSVHVWAASIAERSGASLLTFVSRQARKFRCPHPSDTA